MVGELLVRKLMIGRGIDMNIFIILFIVLYWCSSAYSAITFTGNKWETTFNCDEQTQYASTLNCDGMVWSGNWYFDSNRTQILDLANNSSGGGGRGSRFWVGTGQNNISGTIGVQFPSYQKEIWIRWYMRHQSGYSFSSLQDDKNLYIYSASSSYQVIPEFSGSNYRLAIQGGPDPEQIITSGYGWSQVMGGSSGDGQWHCYEIHLKMDTNGSNGIGRLWIDGTLRASNTAVNYSNNNATAQQGWSEFVFEENGKYISDGPWTVDYDDMVIYNSTPPNTDSGGNPFIGPVGFAGVIGGKMSGGGAISSGGYMR